MKNAGPFDLVNTYLHLEDGGDAMSIKTSPTFWQELMTRSFSSPESRRVGEGDGWLVSLYHFEKDTPAWEMHPLGDEILFLVAGEMDVVFEGGTGRENISIKAGSTCLVPKGLWHRQLVKKPGTLLGITYGKNTQHRPL